VLLSYKVLKDHATTIIIFKLLIIGAWMTLLLYAANQIGKSNSTSGELSRKIVHIGTAATIPMAWAFGLSKILIVSCGILITAFTLINRRWPLLNGIEDIGRKSFGTTAYGLSITLLVAFLWPERADAVTAGILVMGVGDGCAGLIGRHMNSHRWTLFDQTKSLAGTFTMAIASILCLIGLCLSTQTEISIPSVLIISGTAVVLEQFSFAGVDNLSVPISVALLWKLLIH